MEGNRRWARPRCGAARLVCVLLVMSITICQICQSSAIAGGVASLSTLDVANTFLDAIGSYMGFPREELIITKAEPGEAKIGQGIMYDFSVELNEKIVEFSLVADASWESYDKATPALGKRRSEEEKSSEEAGDGVAETDGKDVGDAVGVWHVDKPFSPVKPAATIPAFEMAGPVELWLQDAENVRLAMPHDVDAGKLRRVVVADGAVVKIKGAREVSLIGALQLPLPLGTSAGLNAGGILGLTNRIRAAARAQNRPILSVRVVGPTSLVAVPPQGTQDVAAGRLKVRRLSVGAVELVSRQRIVDDMTEEEDDDEEWGKELVETWVWPLPQLSGSDPRLMGVEGAFHDVLGPAAYEKGSFRLMKAKASAVTLMQVRFEVNHRNTSSDRVHEPGDDEVEAEVVDESMPNRKMTWEATVKIEGKQLKPLSAHPVESVKLLSWQGPTTNNETRGDAGYLEPMGKMNLDVNWGYYGL